MTYPIIIFLLLFALPIGSVVVEHFYMHSTVPFMLLAGKWFVFWSVGIRLFLAGLRQTFQPRFTAEQIFEIKGSEALPFIRELGLANLSMGFLGIISLLKPDFVLPAAIVGGLFYGLAGINHAIKRRWNFNRIIAMISDLYIFLVLAIYVIISMQHF
jgi:hypothetical protein